MCVCVCVCECERESCLSKGKGSEAEENEGQVELTFKGTLAHVYRGLHSSAAHEVVTYGHRLARPLPEY